MGADRKKYGLAEANRIKNHKRLAKRMRRRMNPIKYE